MINLHIKNETKFQFKWESIYKEIVNAIVNKLSIDGDVELSVIITDNIGIKEISNIYRDKDYPTDILSFPTDYKEMKKLIGYNLLGDIYLSYEKVESQALEFGHSSKREWSYLFAHGVLHLLGYDHKTKDEEDEMNSIAYDTMKEIGVNRDA